MDFNELLSSAVLEQVAQTIHFSRPQCQKTYKPVLQLLVAFSQIHNLRCNYDGRVSRLDRLYQGWTVILSGGMSPSNQKQHQNITTLYNSVVTIY